MTNTRRKRLGFVAGVALSCAACGDDPAPRLLETSAQEVIYGESSSREWWERARAPTDLTRTVALVSLAAELEAGAPPTLGERHPELCPEVPWLDQPSLSLCTGALLGGAWAITARHCFEQLACESLVAVRNYAYDELGRLPPPSTGDTFHCRGLVVDGAARGSDLAVFELDRNADVPPIALAEPATVAPGDPVFVAGHPLGTPLKVDEDAWWLGATPPRIWADAFAGSSGAPVAAARGAMLGVLTGGARDFELDARGCFAVRELDELDEAGGEHIELLRDVLCDACGENPAAEACGSLAEADCANADRADSIRAAVASCAVERARAPGRGVGAFLLLVAWRWRRGRAR